jgi:hypothetical protein
VDVPEFLETVVWSITKENANSRKSGKSIFWSYRNSVVFQNFWTCCFRSHRNAVHVPETLGAVFLTLPNVVDVPDILETVVWIITNTNANSRKSGKVIFGHTEILWWSRISGPVVFDPTDGAHSLFERSLNQKL